MKQTIVFVHGMFQNDKSWKKWIAYFEERGFRCIAPAWPGHEGEPRDLRENIPPALGDLRLEEVVKKIENAITPLGEKPIVIGHSVGGLIVQLLANKNMISLGVAIDSVAPNAMLSMDWNFFKNSVKIANPLKGVKPIEQTPESFHEAFCNTLTEADAIIAFEETATHDSRNVLRDCMMKPGHVDLDLPHAPLLFIASEQDHIIPDQLVEKNANHYTDENSIVGFKEFPGRSHYICGEPGWEEVAQFIYEWISEQSEPVNEDGISFRNNNI
jgi:pimeloyl-ACP methyl ester carboxylesterase